MTSDYKYVSTCLLDLQDFLISCAPRSPTPGVHLWSNVTKTTHIRDVKGPAGEGWPHCDHSPSSLICCHYLYEHFKIKNNQRGRTAMWQSRIEGFREKVRERENEQGDILDTLCFIMAFIIPVSDEQQALSYPACSPLVSLLPSSHGSKSCIFSLSEFQIPVVFAGKLPFLRSQ